MFLTKQKLISKKTLVFLSDLPIMPPHRHGVRQTSHAELEREKRKFEKMLDSQNGKRKIRTPNDVVLSATEVR
ncbi:hypothetical protein, partial [Vibrio tubiashii]|uniref:hypothetical protein n=1 Tax=Vibrio tubiashii TaxID=29498 RepID=UPI0019D3279D